MERHVVEISRIKMEKAKIEQRVSVHVYNVHDTCTCMYMYIMLISYYIL